jgi:hypothetical protein
MKRVWIARTIQKSRDNNLSAESEALEVMMMMVTPPVECLVGL